MCQVCNLSWLDLSWACTFKCLEAGFDSGDQSDNEGEWEDVEEEPWDGMLVDDDDVDMADAESD